MLEFGYYNMDCMQGMKEFPDEYFDLAIVDPPYGISIGANSTTIGGGGWHNLNNTRCLMTAPYQVQTISKN